MKMSDYFPLPLRFREFAGVIFIDREHIIRFSHVAHGNAAAHAINNHDRLKEENAKLRELLSDVMECVSQDLWDTRCDDAKQLLTELKEQGNE